MQCMASDSSDESRAEGFRNWVRRYSEEEQATLLIIVGFVLFIIPEPITSIIGIIVLIIGILTWVSDWLWG
jgi:UPF0716 family protein affecting phage T7 exclusion